MRRLCLLALEREQTVAIAYREEAVAAHVDSLALSAELRATNRQTAPFQTRVAAAMILIGVMTRRVPPALRQERRFQSFRRYCALNIVLEKTAELAFGRMVEVALKEEHRETFARRRPDEQRHTEAFQVLCDAITDDGRLAEGWTDNRVIATLVSLSPSFVAAASRPTAAVTDRPRSFGSGARSQFAVAAATMSGSRCLSAALTQPVSTRLR